VCETHPLPRGGTDWLTSALSVAEETHPLPRGGTDWLTSALSGGGDPPATARWY
jgi:hypothetical protein